MLSSHLLHPISVKLSLKGHPWVTTDQFSQKFNAKAEIIEGLDHNKKPIGYFIHDPNHSKIKARYWSKNKPINFEKELTDRLDVAINKRLNIANELKRNIFYFAFAEADQLPGLMILKLDQQLLILIYSYFWKKYLHKITAFLQTKLAVNSNQIWVQYRSEDYQGQAPAFNLIDKKLKKSFNVEEFDCPYQVELGSMYDFGLYPDMSSVRQKLTEIYSKGGNLLNLFSYTGAFSVHALKHGMHKAYSVDLSGDFLQRLNLNLGLNQIHTDRHLCIENSVEDSLNTFILNNQRFELIISDPPSSFHNGKKRVTVLQFYENNLEKLAKLVCKQGHLLLFFNTHAKSTRFYQDKLLSLIKQYRLELKLLKTFKLDQDCPTFKGFPEGDYLKGFLFKVP
jgi:23S rRNA (cytosine1962-C5)-methyltransferase